MADAGIASRRDCEAMIESGVVEVNGQRVDHLPVFVDPSTDRIVVDGRPLKPVRRAPAGDHGAAHAPPGVLPGRVYVMLHKPDRVLTTTRDDAADREGVHLGGGRTTVIDLVEHPSGARLYPVGRLDYHSTGLVLLTNDGALADRLTHARYGVTRTYRVTIKGRASTELLRDLRRRVAADEPEHSSTPAPGAGRIARGRASPSSDAPAPSSSVRIAREPSALAGESPNSVLEITLREGKSRQLKIILEQMGQIVKRLTRVGVGPLRLRGVTVGQWRDLTREEVAMLMAAGGLTQATPARRAPAPGPVRPARREGGAGTPPPPSRSRRERYRTAQGFGPIIAESRPSGSNRPQRKGRRP